MHAHAHTHSLALSSSLLPLTLSLWPWASAASGCCWDLSVGRWRADGERLGPASHDFPSLHLSVRPADEWEKKVFSPPSHSDDRWLLNFFFFFYPPVLPELARSSFIIWIQAPSATSFIFQLRVKCRFKKKEKISTLMSHQRKNSKRLTSNFFCLPPAFSDRSAGTH